VARLFDLFGRCIRVVANEVVGAGRIDGPRVGPQSPPIRLGMTVISSTGPYVSRHCSSKTLQTSLEPSKKIIYLRLGNYQRRRHGDRVPDRPNEALIEASLLEFQGRESGWIKILFRAFVLDNFNSDEQTHAARFANEWMVGQATQSRQQPWADATHVRDDIALLIDFRGFLGSVVGADGVERPAGRRPC
jgi:hypothetical protein